MKVAESDVKVVNTAKNVRGPYAHCDDAKLRRD